ncbi:MAG: TIR domain-containing protein [Leptolyngbya sp. BL-A-14]
MTFGNQLRSFSKAIDIVTDDIRKNILRIIREKLQKSLGIEFVSLHVETIVDDHIGLRTSDWYIGGGKIGSVSLKNSQGDYTTQVSLSFSANKILWIVCNDKGYLSDCNHYSDLCSKTDSNIIPAYLKRSDSLSKTSIILPLSRHHENKPYAVINFESVKYLEYSKRIKDEISSISESISRLYQRNLSHERQVDDTQDEIVELGKVKSYDLTQTPSLFFAFSGEADRSVLNTIQEIFSEEKYGNLDLKRWDQDVRSGSIQNQIFDNIRDCHFGICYLSEPDGEEMFKDNANVLIEVGMFWYKSEDFNNVILIREKSSSKVPFDIANNRIIFVPRDKSTKELDARSFKREFQKMLDKMLDA